MKKSKLIQKTILASTLLLQLGTFCFHADGAAGDVDLSFDPGSGVNGSVSAVAVQPDGKVIIAGDFTTVKGLSRPGIARLNADGSGDSSFAAADYRVPSALALQPDGKVLLSVYSSILRLNTDGSLDSAFSASIASFDEGIYSIAVQSDGKVLIGGHFTVVNGTSRNGLARLNANGTVDNSFSPGVGTYGVYAIAVQPDEKVLIGGYLSVSGTNRVDIARLNANGSWDSSFNSGTGPNARVESLALQSDGKVLIGGAFTAFNGTNCNGIARLNANGSLDGSFNPGSVLTYNYLTYAFMVYSLAVQADGKVVIGGSFSVNGTNSNNLARFNANGTLDGAFNPGAGADGEVYSVGLQPDGRVVTGGNFTAVNGTVRSYVARLNTAGSVDSGFDPGKAISGYYADPISSLVVQPDGKVLLGGWFNDVQGVYRNHVARLNANGRLDSTFDPGTGANGPVQAVAVQADGKVLIGGQFSTVNGTNCNSVARLNANGSLDLSFQPNVATINPGSDCPPGYFCSTGLWTTTHLLVQPDGQVLIGGHLATYVWPAFEGEDMQIRYRPFIGRFNVNGSRDNSFDAGINASWSYSPLTALILQPDGKVLVGRYEGISRLNPNGTLDSSFNTVVVGDPRSIALQPDGKLIVGGSLFAFNSPNRQGLVRLHANGSLDDGFNVNTGVDGRPVYSVAVQPDGRLIVGGSFITVNGTNRNYLARLNADGSVDHSFNPGTGPNEPVSSIVLQPDGNILIGGYFTTVKGVLRPNLARIFGDAVAPSLSIARSNTMLIISWPVTSLNFQLKETSNLALPNSWSSVAQTAVTNGNQVSVTLPTTNGSKFFRLGAQ